MEEFIWNNTDCERLFRQASLKNMAAAVEFAGRCLTDFRDKSVVQFELENYTPVYMEVVLHILNYCLNEAGFKADFNSTGDNRCFEISRR